MIESSPSTAVDSSTEKSQGLALKNVKTVPHLSIRQIMEGKGVAVGEEHDGSFHTYMAHKISKLQTCNLINDQNVVADIFRGCYVYINGTTEPPVEELRRLIIRHGGFCDNYKTSRITHFACNNFTDAQLKNIREKVKIKEKLIYVTTNWILDSISKQRKLSEADYSPIGLKDRHGSNIVQIFSGFGAAVRSDSVPEDAVHPKELNLSADGSDVVTSVDASNGAASLSGTRSNYTYDEMISRSEDLQEQNRTRGSSNIKNTGGSGDVVSSSNEGKDFFSSDKNSDMDSTSAHQKEQQLVNRNRQHSRIASVETEPQTFLKQYFTQSRLHFIGSWRNRLPTMVNRLLKMKKAQADAAHSKLKTSSSEVSFSPAQTNTVNGLATDGGRENGSHSNSLMTGMDNDNSDDECDDQRRGDEMLDFSTKGGNALFHPATHAPLQSKVNHGEGDHRQSSAISRVVIHMDMDCFFVSAVLRSDGMKHLRDQPVAVAHSADTPYNNTSSASDMSYSHSILPSPGTGSGSGPGPSAPSLSNRSTMSPPKGLPASYISTSSFSSSSEISSCNYPARESGTRPVSLKSHWDETTCCSLVPIRKKKLYFDSLGYLHCPDRPRYCYPMILGLNVPFQAYGMECSWARQGNSALI
jgi:BRCT domain, a BRCA1 C-terminus domain/impB/mucB/samB family